MLGTLDKSSLEMTIEVAMRSFQLCTSESSGMSDGSVGFVTLPLSVFHSLSL